MNKATLYLQGGLGNLCFIYAVTYMATLRSGVGKLDVWDWETTASWAEGKDENEITSRN